VLIQFIVTNLVASPSVGSRTLDTTALILKQRSAVGLKKVFTPLLLIKDLQFGSQVEEE
jgi:hypothetical protein